MTNFEKIMQSMTPETMANERVKLVLVNQGEPFYMTSRGQLYNFNNLQGAVIDEYNFLISAIPETPNTKEEPKEDKDKETPKK